MHNQNTHTGPSFSIRNRMARVLWSVCCFLFFRYTPRPLHGFRSFVLRCFGAKVGRGVHVYPGAKIWAPWNLNLADGCSIASGATAYSQGIITIGINSVISQGVNLCAGTHDYTLTGFPLVTQPINIGNEVWIAAEAFVHPGVTIADGCVIGARAVVTKDMPAWMVCTGHPCQPIKQRVLEGAKTKMITRVSQTPIF